MFTSIRPLFAASVVLIASSLAAQSRSGSFYKSIGNSYLGGVVYSSASLSATSTISRSAADGSVYLGADANVLGHTLAVAQLDLNAHNDITRTLVSNGGIFFRPVTVQTARASFRLKFAGIEVANRSVTTTGDLGGIPLRTQNLFAQDVTATVPLILGISVRLGGNAGVRFGAGANVILPAGVAEVRPAVSATAAAVGRAHVALVFNPGGISIAGVGVEVRGTFADTRITGGVTASVTNGLSGFVNFQMRAINLVLVVFGELFGFRRDLRELTNWSFGFVNQDLISI